MKGQRDVPSGEAGFTLIEALIAIVILLFGLAAVANLFVVSASSNTVANLQSATTVQATETMERLKAINFDTLTAGGSLTASTGSIANCNDAVQDCVIAGNFNRQRAISGVSTVRTLWTIQAVGGTGDTYFITVRSESTGTLGGARSRAEFTTFRVRVP